jgi:hypothetical protein
LILGQAQAQGTLQSLDMTRIFLEAEITATYIAPTLWAADTGTAQAWQEINWTVEANGTNTKEASNMTQTASLWTPTPHYTMTVEAASASASATALYAASASTELALDREKLMNRIWAVTPWAALVIVLLFSLALAWRWSQVRVIQRDLRGDAPLIITGATVYDADRNPGPVLDMSSGRPQAPALAPPELQAATTSRDQLVDLATRGSFSGPQRRSVARRLTNSQPAPHPGQPALPPIEVVDAVEVREWIDEAEQKLLIDGGAE